MSDPLASACRETKHLPLLCSFLLTFKYVFAASQERPVDHWPNIVSILLDKNQELNSLDKTVFFFDIVSMTHVCSTPEGVGVGVGLTPYHGEGQALSESCIYFRLEEGLRYHELK